MIAGAGDIAGVVGRQQATSDLLVNKGLTAVFTLGDNAYETGTPSQFAEFYAPTWGRLKSITYPSPGNHDYESSGASGYFGYFGAAAGPPTRGYYSYDISGWHLIVLNSNCAEVGGCYAGSAQEGWLRADLARNRAKCTIAYWHHPRFSSGRHGSDPQVAPFWDALHAAGVELVLSGHDHDYERFAPQSPNGTPNPTGIREFVVGTGGMDLRRFSDIQPNSEVRNDETHGVLRLTLHPSSYDWQFVPTAGSQFTDSGSDTCH